MDQTFYHILPNGVRMVHCQTPSPVVYTGVMVGAGTRDEQPADNGMAHYIEHCVFKGTARHTARQIIQRIEGIGGEINAYTTKEETVFYAATLPEHLSATFRLLAEMVLCPTFPTHETDKEVTVICDEIDSYRDSPSELIYDDFEALLFRDHPLAMPILGTRRTLRHISRTPAQPLRWMAAHYRPERIVLFSRGNIAPDRFFRLAEQAFGSYAPASRLTASVPETFAKPAENAPANAPAAPEPPAATRLAPAPIASATASYHRRTHQTHLMLGARAYPLGHPRQLALYLLNNIVGGPGLNAHLNLILRESRGLVYTVESSYVPLSDTGYWATYFACDPENADRCLSLTRQELARLCERPLSDAAFRRALVQLRGQMAIASQNNENAALAMAKSVLYHGTAPSWQETYATIAALTPADLFAAAQDTFTPDHLSLLTYA